MNYFLTPEGRCKWVIPWTWDVQSCNFSHSDGGRNEPVPLFERGWLTTFAETFCVSFSALLKNVNTRGQCRSVNPLLLRRKVWKQTVLIFWSRARACAWMFTSLDPFTRWRHVCINVNRLLNYCLFNLFYFFFLVGEHFSVQLSLTHTIIPHKGVN